MANDRASLLKQRLRRGSDSFSFNALIEGVSTLEDLPGIKPAPEPAAANLAVQAETAGNQPADHAEVTQTPATVVEQPTLVLYEESASSSKPDTESQRLRWALATLTRRFTEQTAQFASALGSWDAESAGYHLAQLNQALELLQPLDPSGDVARGLDLPDAPPSGRAWPSPAWSFVEFAESPFSGLLPNGAGESYVREVLYGAWGLTPPKAEPFEAGF